MTMSEHAEKLSFSTGGDWLRGSVVTVQFLGRLRFANRAAHPSSGCSNQMDKSGIM